MKPLQIHLKLQPCSHIINLSLDHKKELWLNCPIYQEQNKLRTLVDYRALHLIIGICTQHKVPKFVISEILIRAGFPSLDKMWIDIILSLKLYVYHRRLTDGDTGIIFDYGLRCHRNIKTINSLDMKFFVFVGNCILFSNGYVHIRQQLFDSGVPIRNVQTNILNNRVLYKLVKEIFFSRAIKSMTACYLADSHLKKKKWMLNKNKL